MARRTAKNPSSTTRGDDGFWQQLGLPESILSAAIAAFGTPERAMQWIEVFEEVAPDRHRNMGGSVFYWRQHDCYLADLKESGLTPQDFARWARAGVSPLWVPTLAKHVRLDYALAAIRNWGADPTVDRWEESARELATLLDEGLAQPDLSRLMNTGLTGHQIYEWSGSGLPPNEWQLWRARGLAPGELTQWVESGLPAEAWLEWRERGVDPRYAREIWAAGEHRPEVAARWAETGLSMSSVVSYKRLGCSPQDAARLTKAGLQPQDLMRGVEGMEVSSGKLELRWTDFFAPPRSSAPVFALRGDLAQARYGGTSDARSLRLQRALDDLGSCFVGLGTMFGISYRGLAFLDGGWASRIPYGLSGPAREWVVGLDALALLCQRMRVELVRSGRFRSVAPADELEVRWEAQRRDAADLRKRSHLLADAGCRPELEKLASRLRSPEPIPDPRPPTHGDSHPITPIPRGIKRQQWHPQQSPS